MFADDLRPAPLSANAHMADPARPEKSASNHVRYGGAQAKLTSLECFGRLRDPSTVVDLIGNTHGRIN